MMKVLYAWELGGGQGHLVRWRQVAAAITAHGGVCQAALQQLPTPAPAHTTTAPIMPIRPFNPQTFTDILTAASWAEAATLQVLTKQWLQLMQGVDVVCIDHAPTATLAAHLGGYPTVHVGEPFYLPPLLDPLPDLRPWQPTPAPTRQARDRAVLAVVNQVAKQFNHPGFTQLADAMLPTIPALWQVPALECYPDRLPQHQQYWGLLPPPAGEAPVWPVGAGPKLFSYLPAEHPWFEVIITALNQWEGLSLVYSPRPPTAPLSPRVKWVNTPVDLAQAAAQTTVALTVAPTTTAHFLLQGRPVLVPPQQLEQFLYARRVGEGGAGLVLRPDQPATPSAIVEALQRLSQPDSTFTQAAQAFAINHPQPYTALEKLLATLGQLIPPTTTVPRAQNSVL